VIRPVFSIARLHSHGDAGIDYHYLSAASSAALRSDRFSS